MKMMLSKEQSFRMIKFLVYPFLILSPVTYLIAMFFVDVPLRDGGETHILFYIIFFVSMVLPLFGFLIERNQIHMYKNKQITTEPEKINFGISIVKFALVNAIYVLGLTVYFITGDFARTLFFYPIGIVWTFVHWPSEAKYKQFLEKVNEDESTS